MTPNSDRHPTEKSQKRRAAEYMAIGMTLGLAIGAALGNPAAGLTLGVAFGAAFGVPLSRRKSPDNKE